MKFLSHKIRKYFYLSYRANKIMRVYTYKEYNFVFLSKLNLQNQNYRLGSKYNFFCNKLLLADNANFVIFYYILCKNKIIQFMQKLPILRTWLNCRVKLCIKIIN